MSAMRARDQSSGEGHPGRIFISYRRGDTHGQAHALRERLIRSGYEPSRVFMDVDSIAPGTPFAQQIEEELDSTGVMLVLIGRDWLGARGRRRLEDPVDYVRLEVSAALDRDIPIIPVLIDGTALPLGESLPEPLRPLIQKQTASLENVSYEADMSRLVNAVERYVRPVEAVPRRPWWRSPKVLAAAGGVAAAAIAGVVLLTVPHPPAKPAPSLSASPAVLRVQSPDRLTISLLKGFTPKNIPTRASVSRPELTKNFNGLNTRGLVAAIRFDFSGPAGMSVWYYIFDNQGDASQDYQVSPPTPAGYRLAAHFTATSIGDPTKCAAARSVAQSRGRAWSCLTLSGTVESYSFVIGDTGTHNGTGLDKSLALGAVRNLRSIAGTTSPSGLATPPGMTQMAGMTGSGLYIALLKPFPAALAPEGLKQPALQPLAAGKAPPTGQIGGEIQVVFSGPNAFDAVQYYVFDTQEHAHSWILGGIAPGGGADPRNSNCSALLSGFPSSQYVTCGTFSQAAAAGSRAQGVSLCAVQWGDVVIAGITQRTSNLKGGDTDLAVTLARAGLLRVAQVTS
jgi:TIR domain